MRLLSSVFILFLFGCNNNKCTQIAKTNSSTYTIRIPLTEIANNDFIESAEYIFLDQEYLIGKIGRMLFYNNDVYIHDEMTGRIVVFSNKGKYLYSIDNKGKGPLEYYKLTDFTIDKSNGNVLIYDQYSHKVISFSTIKREFVKEHKIEFYPSALACTSDRLYFYNPFTSNYPREEKYHYSLITTSPQLKDEKRYFKVGEKIGNFMSDPNRKGFFYGNGLYLLNRFGNDIYSLNGDSISVNCKILFENNEDYLSALNDAIEKGTRNTLRYKKCAADIRDFCETTNHISFRYMRNNKQYSVVYSKKENEIIAHEANYIATSPLLMKRNIPIYLFPSNVTNDSFVSTLPFYCIDQIIHNEKVLNEMDTHMTDKHLLKKLKTVDENSNPILVFYKFKTKLK